MIKKRQYGNVLLEKNNKLIYLPEADVILVTENNFKIIGEKRLYII